MTSSLRQMAEQAAGEIVDRTHNSQIADAIERVAKAFAESAAGHAIDLRRGKWTREKTIADAIAAAEKGEP